MSKYLVETFYTCTFKIVHKLNELNEKNLSDLENRKDGAVEIIATGNAVPFTFELENLSNSQISTQLSNIFSTLSSGSYSIVVKVPL